MSSIFIENNQINLSLGGQGTPGVGVPSAGLTGQILAKNSDSNFDTKWIYSNIINVKNYGAKGDGATDDTVAINNAIIDCFNSGGGIVFFPPGTYMASQIVIYATVMLDGGFVSAVELKQIAASNKDFVISFDFASLTGTNKYYPLNPEVPYFFGVKDIRINGNKANNASGRGIAWYGNAQFMYGTVDVYDCAGDNIYTESSSNAEITTWQTQEEGYFETVISRTSGGKGWHFKGCHDSRIKTYNCILGEGGDYGWYNESAGTDYITQMHIYAAAGVTNRKGAYFGNTVNIGWLYGDATTIVVDTSAGFTTIDTAVLGDVGAYSGYIGLDIKANDVSINRITSTGAITGQPSIAVKLEGSGIGIGQLQFYGNDRPNMTCLYDIGGGNQINNIFIQHLSGSGGIGIYSNCTESSYIGQIQNCATCFSYNQAGKNTVDLTIFTNSGQDVVSGVSPFITDRFNIVATGSTVGYTQNSIFATFAVDAVAVVSLTIPHGLLYTPQGERVALSIVKNTNVTDYNIGFFRVDSTDSTNIYCSIKITTASATSGATAYLTAFCQNY